jgi:uncharacterized membrane protein YedE/YeeE
MKTLLSSLLAGVLFGTGLVVSGMTDPSKVKGFLDFAGHWDMSLLWVMVGAIAIYSPAFWLQRRKDPTLTRSISPAGPPKRVDTRLLLGAGIFGVGWGLAGVCPGPAIAALSTSASMAVVAVAIMLGIALHDFGLKALMRNNEKIAANPAVATRDAACLD